MVGGNTNVAMASTYSESNSKRGISGMIRTAGCMGLLPAARRIAAILLIAAVPLAAKTYYVSPTGNDLAAGSIDQPFLTIGKAYSALVAGDTIFVRGGYYALSATITLGSKTGAGPSNQCYLLAFPGEHPVLDFSAQTSSDALKVNGTYWYVKGLEIQFAFHNGIAVNGSYNTIVNCPVHDNRNTGLQLGNNASYNQIINCDSYYNYDAPAGGNADGFAPKLDVGTGNYFYGCRSWQNSDDGWDGYLRPSDSVYTTIENCWSFMNGYLKNGSPIATGNGNGFKMGGGDNSNGDSLRHLMTIKNCLSFDNRVKGYDQNNNRGSMTLLNCTAYRNGSYNFSIPGIRRVGTIVTVINCISLASAGVTLLNPQALVTNSWMSPFSIATSDFVSLDTTGVRGPRKPDGSLPDISFMHLAASSQFVNAGTDVGIPFLGPAPDLGAFETSVGVGIRNQEPPVSTFELDQNYPNPFNPTTTIWFSVKENERVVLNVFNVLGQEVARLFDGIASRNNRYRVEFDGRTLSGGTYLCVLTAHGVRNVRKMVLVK